MRADWAACFQVRGYVVKSALATAVSAAAERANATGVSVRNTAFTARRLFSAQAADNLLS
jgi:hypothetical protein